MKGIDSAWRIVALALPLFVGGCGSNESSENATAPMRESLRPKDESTNADLERKAIDAAFPDGASVIVDDQRYDFDSHRLINAPFGKVLISEGRQTPGTHAAAGLISATYLAQTKAGYSVVKQFREAVVSGSMGAMGGWEVRNDMGSNPVIEAEGGGTWQGYSCTWITLTELRPGGPKELVTFQSSYDDSGVVETNPTSIEGRITEIGPDALNVRYTGSRTFDARYVRKDGVFVLQGGNDKKLPEC